MNIEVLTIGGVLLLAIIRIMDAFSGRTTADADASKAVTTLALSNDNERRYLQEQLSKLREDFSREQGAHAAEKTALQEQLGKLQVKADGFEEKARSNENQMNEVIKARTADQERINSLEAEIKNLNKTIVTLTEENNDLKKRLNELYERFIGKQSATPPRVPSAPSSSADAIPIELTLSGGITATSPLEKPPPHEDIA